LEGKRQQRLGSPSGQSFPNCRLVAALILAMGSILSVRVSGASGSSGEPSPGGQGRGTAGGTGLGRRLISNPEVKLTLRVYDYVPIDPVLLARAERVTDAIFAESGIRIVWMDCTPLRGEFVPRETCPSDMEASDLVLRFFPRRMAMKVATPKEPLGFAQQCPETEPACELTVFYFRVDELTAEGHRAEVLLGHVIAHEVAHVLIGPGHSEEGIMRREWSREELGRMSLGLQMSFSSAQSRQLQDAVLRRMKLSIPVTSARADSLGGQSKAGE
jgi:hypothetical protein